MGFAEERGGYWRGRYKAKPGVYGSVKDETGAVARFRSRRAAEQAADEKEAEVRAGLLRVKPVGRWTFARYADVWYVRQDLAASTMQNYRRRLEEHLLPVFGEMLLADISRDAVAAWEKRERAAGYAESSIRSWRALLHLVLADAAEENLVVANVAAKRKGRGKRTALARHRGAEKTITTALGVLLIAERAALLSGRDDEFAAVTTMGFTGMRWGELVGLEPSYVRPGAVRVEWQLYELDDGTFVRCPPKDESRRTVAVPDWTVRLLTDHLGRVRPQPCSCHGRRYVFSGHRATKGKLEPVGPRLADVARRAEVAIGTASAVLAGKPIVADATRERVLAAVEDLGYVRGRPAGQLAAHWRRNGFATWLFQPAATGRYPAKAPRPVSPVPILADPWPGVPVRGRGAASKADACWAPIAPGLTPHGLRHTYKTLMIELGTPATLMDAQMGHADGSVQAIYSHVTQEMIERLLGGLTTSWRAALETRRALNPRSPVAVLDRLLTEVDERASQDFLPGFSRRPIPTMNGLRSW
jgi:integrase